MNSKQLNFFLVLEGLSEVYAFFNRMDVKYVRMNKYQPDEITLEKFPLRDGAANGQIYITQPEFSSKIYTRENKLMSEYRMDLDKSWVIEFSPGGINLLTPVLIKEVVTNKILLLSIYLA